MRKYAFALALLLAIPLAAQQPAPPQPSASSTPQEQIAMLRAEIREGRQELKARIAFEKASCKLAEAQLRRMILQQQEAARLADAVEAAEAAQLASATQLAVDARAKK